MLKHKDSFNKFLSPIKMDNNAILKLKENNDDNDVSD
jgi:hypothetical protein